MRCPRCGAENPAALSTCEVCGSPLRRVTVVDDNAPAPRQSLWQSPAPPPTTPDHPPPVPAPASPPAAAPAPRAASPVSPAVGQAWQGPLPASPAPAVAPQPAPQASAQVPKRTVLGAVDPEEAVGRQVRGVLLEYRSRTDTGKVHALHAGRTAIGRSADCDIVLDDQQASKQHAIIYVRGDDASFMDISSNGSVIDGRRVHGGQTTLQQGSTIVIGARLYVFLYTSERALAGMK